MDELILANMHRGLATCKLVRNCRLDNTNFIPVLVGLASFFLMPQSPAKTKSWWNPKGYFTEREVKIIVNSGKFASLNNYTSPC